MPVTPILQVRVIGPHGRATQLLAQVADAARSQFSHDVVCRTQICSARRRGHVRAYLTVTPVKGGDHPCSQDQMDRP